MWLEASSATATFLPNWSLGGGKRWKKTVRVQGYLTVNHMATTSWVVQTLEARVHKLHRGIGLHPSIPFHNTQLSLSSHLLPLSIERRIRV